MTGTTTSQSYSEIDRQELVWVADGHECAVQVGDCTGGLDLCAARMVLNVIVISRGRMLSIAELQHERRACRRLQGVEEATPVTSRVRCLGWFDW